MRISCSTTPLLFRTLVLGRGRSGPTLKTCSRRKQEAKTSRVLPGDRRFPQHRPYALHHRSCYRVPTIPAIAKSRNKRFHIEKGRARTQPEADCFVTSFKRLA